MKLTDQQLRELTESAHPPMAKMASELIRARKVIRTLRTSKVIMSDTARALEEYDEG